MKATSVTFTAIENSAYVLLARVAKISGADIIQSDITGPVTIKVYDTTSGTQAGSTQSIATANCIYNTLQTDARWEEDDTGYNVAVQMPGSTIPEGARKYHAEAKFTPSDGSGAFYVIWPILTKNIHSE